MGYISAQQAALKWGISKRRVQVLCTENRIENATRIGNMWVVPEDALKPADGRAQNRHKNESPTTRAARTALKKITAKAYLEINEKTNNPCLSKMLFVSLFAATVFCDIQKNEAQNDRKEVFLTISSDLFGVEFVRYGQETFYDKFSYLLLDFEKYIYRYADYLDDILSWAYQYVNKLSLDSGLENTQFFTEEYMIDYLTNGIAETTTANSVYLDPACGGGNFLSHIMDQLFALQPSTADDPIVHIQSILNSLYGYELDPHLAMVASVNLKLKALMLLSKEKQVHLADWKLFCPNIYTSIVPNEFGFLESDFFAHRVKRIADGQQETLHSLTSIATEIYTNPPFQTVKGMANSMKEHLKKHFPNAKCDLCNAFIMQCLDKIQDYGTIGLITQTSWMYLDSFESFRKEIVANNSVKAIVDLGSGAFYDLSGEKANVALVKITKTPHATERVRVLSLRDIPLKEKVTALENASITELFVPQAKLFSGEYTAFSLNNTSPCVANGMSKKYGDFAVPMQGTSTGDATRLISYYWEHLNDPVWIPVSKGGSYSRWCGLNTYVLKWGAEGEYIRATKGSVLRNTKYFDRTSLVYSDTGTAGFNARLLEDNQLFVASGPGIRDVTGSPYAHLALLNSRVFSYFLRALSPKLTVAAGYISRVPVPAGLFDKRELDRFGQRCYTLKKEQLKVRPNNMEWSSPKFEENSLNACAYRLFVKEMQNELAKLNCEKKLDEIILEAYALDDVELSKLNAIVGIPAVAITGEPSANTLDRAIAQILDANCQIVRNRVNRQSLGCDGALEFVARKEQASPKKIVELISSSPQLFAECRTKYKTLVLHNIVLTLLGFRVKDYDNMRMAKLRQGFNEMYPNLSDEWDLVEEWISEHFNSIHTQAFSNRPYYYYEEGNFVKKF